MKNSFVLYTDYAEHINMLNTMQKGTLLEAIFAHETGCELPEMDGITSMAFSFIKQQLERDSEKWEDKCKKRSDAGKQGGAPKGNENAKKIDDEKQAKQAKQADNVTVTVNDNDNDNDTVNDNDIHTLTLSGDLLSALEKLTVPDNAAEAHKAVVDTLSNLGYACDCEYPVPDRGDGRKGRIDIYAKKDEEILAIEVDRLSPREKSIFKLRQIEGAKRIILLRGRDIQKTIYQGIQIIGLNIYSPEDELFSQFWEAYPRKVNKQNAQKAFKKLKVTDALLRSMLSALEKQKKSDQWKKDGGEYIPHPSTWLNGRRWEDETEVNDCENYKELPGVMQL